MAATVAASLHSQWEIWLEVTTAAARSTRRSRQTEAAGSPCAATGLQARRRWSQARARSRWRKVRTDARMPSAAAYS